MGNYYLFANPTTKERVEPFCIGEGGIKQGAIIYGDAAHVFVWLKMHEEQDGPGWSIVGDYQEGLYDRARDLYKDITRETLDAFNAGSGVAPVPYRSREDA